jgi:DNA repair ATPase RecN
MNPRPSSRISSLEKRATTIEAAIEELSSDQAEELKTIRRDIKQLSEHMDVSFNQAHAYIDHYMAELKAIIATKDDISRIEARQDRQEQLLQEILSRLPKPPGS